MSATATPFLLLLVTLVYAVAGLLGVLAGVRACASLCSFADGPAPGRPKIAVLIGVAAAWGFASGLHTPGWLQISLGALVTIPLIACWYSDAFRGLLPDLFTLAPLIVLVLGALVLHLYGPVLAAIVVPLPFAFAAALSRGLGMGWGDVKLVAFGGALLGLEAAVLACGAACVLALALAIIRNRRHDPVAFGPYLVGFFGTFAAMMGAR